MCKQHFVYMAKITHAMEARHSMLFTCYREVFGGGGVVVSLKIVWQKKNSSLAVLKISTPLNIFLCGIFLVPIAHWHACSLCAFSLDCSQAARLRHSLF